MSDIKDNNRTMYAHGRDSVNAVFDATTGSIELVAKTVQLGNIKLDGVIASEEFEQLKSSLERSVSYSEFLDENREALIKYKLIEDD